MKATVVSLSEKTIDTILSGLSHLDQNDNSVINATRLMNMAKKEFVK